MARGTQVDAKTKAEILKLVKTGESMSSLGKQFSVSPTTIYGWKYQKKAQKIADKQKAKVVPSSDIEKLVKQFVADIEKAVFKKITSRLLEGNV